MTAIYDTELFIRYLQFIATPMTELAMLLVMFLNRFWLKLLARLRNADTITAAPRCPFTLMVPLSLKKLMLSLSNAFVVTMAGSKYLMPSSLSS